MDNCNASQCCRRRKWIEYHDACIASVLHCRGRILDLPGNTSQSLILSSTKPFVSQHVSLIPRINSTARQVILAHLCRRSISRNSKFKPRLFRQWRAYQIRTTSSRLISKISTISKLGQRIPRTLYYFPRG